MLFHILPDDLRRMYVDPNYDGAYGRPVARGFRKVILVIANAKDERDFYNMKSLHYEKLKGNRSHQRSMRINIQYRLMVEIGEGSNGKIVLILSIEDYH